MKRVHFFSSIVFFLIVMNTPVLGGAHVSGRLMSTLSAAGPDEPIHCWVYFTDKGTVPLSKLADPSTLVSERSLRRRANVLPPGQLVDETDLPLESDYVNQVAVLVTRLRQRSKWLNAVSVSATPAQLAAVEALPFVSKLDLVARFLNPRIVPDAAQPTIPDNALTKTGHADTLDYGLSLAQLNQISVPPVHAAGNSAQGIVIGVLDNGFRLLGHRAFDSLRTRLIATYDFVDHKVDVTPNDPDPGFGAHGVITLSTIGGYGPGHLIGPAFGATYILARTENDSSGNQADFYPSEEDNWIAAIEWADSLGVQVTSTSLGYLEHLPPARNWTWQDMDGETIPITHAANLAVGKGIIVCNSAGNEGYNASHNTLVAPADADSILTVGAVMLDGSRASFSSIGPTVGPHPQIKPNVMALGSGTICANPQDTAGYITASGTSLACPLAAGCAALVLKAHPTASPRAIMNALEATASNAGAPNNLIGWGIINVAAAINYLNPHAPATTFSLAPNHPNPFTGSTTIPYTLPEASSITITVYNILGQKVRILASGQQSPAESSVEWDGTNDAGNRVGSGVYFYRIEAAGITGNSFLATGKMVLIR